MDVDLFLAAECCALAVTVIKSSIPHSCARFALFAAKGFCPSKTVSSYHETLIYNNLVDKNQKLKGLQKSNQVGPRAVVDEMDNLNSGQSI